ncbi:response regulator [Paucidesulfovibrio longus]|uniref:response regulator n=1 Tax=Paucidesulfovibrio longus TaxID=889 RepID=UPI0003B4CEAC|nr:response regulator [Paucidesulfovibrio longus]
MNKVKVLVVDDERDFVKLFVKRFVMRNLDVDGVTSGQEALEYLRENPVDVIVLDVKMPGMDGLETLKEIKKRCPQVEVIMLTGHGSVKSGIQGISLGAYDYVLKPFKIEDLLERILKAYERTKLNRGR